MGEANTSGAPCSRVFLCFCVVRRRIYIVLRRRVYDPPQHERAVVYFQRALRLDRRFLCAWTLMGHEFIEMKNTAAAIEA